MDCPICNRTMEVLENASRQEHEEIKYSCPDCNLNFIREICYQLQSSMVASDTLYDDLWNEVFPNRSKTFRKRVEELEKAWELEANA